MQPQQFRRLCRQLAVAVTAALIAGSGAVAAPTSDKGTKYYYDHAVELIAKGDLRGAVIELKNALQKDPKDLASRVLLGRTYVDLENGGAAAIELSRARRDGARDSFVLVPLGRAYLLQGDYRKVLKEISPTGQDQRTAAEITTIRGDAHLALGEHKDAETAYLEASKMRPNDARPLVGLARVKLADDDVEGARNYVGWAIEANPKDPAAWFIQGEVAELRGRKDEALTSYDRAVERAPEFTRALIARATIRLDQGNYAQAEPDLHAVRKISPRDPHAAYLMSLIESRRGNHEKAQALLAEAEATLQGYPTAFLQSHAPSNLLAGVVTYLRRDYSASWLLLNHFLKRVPQHKHARKILAAIALIRDEPKIAIQLLEYLNPRKSHDVDVLTMYGDALTRVKRYDEANRVLERATSIVEPGTSQLFKLVVVRLGAGHNDAAMKLLQREIENTPEAVKAAIMLGTAQLKTGDFKAALDTLNGVTARKPDNAVAYNLAGGAYIGLKDIKSAKASYERAVEAAPDYIDAIENLGKVEVRLGNLDRAAELFSVILEKDAENGKAMIALANIARRRDNQENMFRWLEKARSSSRDRETAALRLIDLYIGARRPEDALAVARQLQADHPAENRYLAALGRALLAARKLEQAVETFRDLANRAVERESADEIYLAAVWQLRARDRQGARESLEKALAADAHHRLSHVELFKLDIAAGNLESALARARKLASVDPGAPLGDMLQGDVHMRQRRYDSAIRAYDAALQKDEDTSLVERAYRARYAAGRDALDFVKGWADKRPDDPAGQRLLAIAYAHAGRPRDAIRIYETLLAKSPDNIAILNNLAMLYQQAGDKRALDFAKRAYEAAPTQPVTMDTYGWVLVKSGNIDEGLAILRNAKLRAPEMPDIRYHIAVALNALGQTGEAIAELRAALAIREPFDDMAAARALLAKLATGKK